jgi:hypothetical protein
MKLLNLILLWSLLLSTISVYAQNSVGIGVANPNKNAVLELISPGNNQGLLIPKLTTAQRTAASFTGALTTKENGLMVFDSDDNMFYYWQAGQWKVFGTTQDLQLIGSTLMITGNPSATSIDLSPFTGTNTDDQVLSYNSGTGVLSISRLSGGPQTVTLSTAGTAGGDLSGTYPNPTVAANAINSAKIADGTIAGADILDGTIATVDLAADAVTSAKILDGTIASADILDGTVTGTDVLDGTIATVDLAADAVTSAKILDATITSNDILNATIVSADIANNTVTGANILDATIASVDIVDGSVANIDLAANSVASANIIDGTVAAVDLAANSVATGNIVDGTVAAADLAANSVASSNIIDGTIVSADLASNAISTTNIIDGTITDADISSSTHIDVSKLSIGTNGQVLTTSGASALWADPSGSVLINNAGTRNLFAGASVGSPAAVGTSSDNTFYGFSAGAPNTVDGQYNVAIGANAGYRNVNGDLNVLIGWFAGSAITGTGFNGDVMIGAQTGEKTTDGPNTFVGVQTGRNNTTGTLNVFVGGHVGNTNVNGASNILIGDLADVTTAGLSNAIAIGYQATVDASNKVRIGNSAVTVIQGQVGFTAASDRRLKTDIQSLTAGLDFIKKLKPVSYVMKDLDDKRTNWGFIAQDIEALLGTGNAVLTIGNDKDRTLGLRYTDFVAPLVKAVQEQQNEIDNLNHKLTENEKKYEALAVELEQIRKAIGLKAAK